MALRLLIDEDCDVKIVPFLRARGHDVIEARALFGERTKDLELMAWAYANEAVYVTGDARFAVPRRSTPKRSAFLVLRGLEENEERRLMELVDVVEREGELAGCPAFFMVIGPRDFRVAR